MITIKLSKNEVKKIIEGLEYIPDQKEGTSYPQKEIDKAYKLIKKLKKLIE